MAVSSPLSSRQTVAALLTLTAVTGLVDAVSYLRLGRVFVANMTGNVVFLGFSAAPHSGLSAAASIIAIAAALVTAVAVAFVTAIPRTAGAAHSTAIIKHSLTVPYDHRERTGAGTGPASAVSAGA